jgi:glycosyltransferase involved in cell wall biosynthesis
MSERTTVVFVATSFGETLHGPDVYARNLWRSLRNSTNLDFHVVAPAALAVGEQDDNLHLVGTTGGSVSSYRQLAAQAVEIAHSIDPSAIVHFNTGHMPLPSIPRDIRSIGHVNDPWAATVHPISWAATRDRGARRTLSLAWRHRMERTNLSKFGVVVANSEFLREILLTQYPKADPAAVVVLYKSVDVDFFNDASSNTDRSVGDPLRLTYIGANTYQKGLDLLLGALQMTSDPLHLDVIGPTESAVRSQYGTLLAAVPATCSINLLGPCDRESIRKSLQRSDLLVSPARGEAFGVTTLEALASGCYVIGTTGGGTGEILGDSGCGQLVPPDSIESLASALIEIDRIRPFERSDFATRSREVADRFNLPTMLANLKTIYASV